MLWNNFVSPLALCVCVMWNIFKRVASFHLSDIILHVGWVFGCADQVELHIIDVVWILFATKGYTPKIDQTGLDTYPPLQVGLYTAYMKLGVY